MSHILICVTPAPGHVSPMLVVAAYLQAVGHSIIFNAGAVFRDRIEASGIRFVPFTGLANYDYRQLETTFPDRQPLQSGSEQLIYDPHSALQLLRHILVTKTRPFSDTTARNSSIAAT